MTLSSTAQWQAHYDPHGRRRLIEAILVLWPELLLLGSIVIEIAQFVARHRLLIIEVLEVIRSNADLFVAALLALVNLMRLIEFGLEYCAVVYGGFETVMPVAWRVG